MRSFLFWRYFAVPFMLVIAVVGFVAAATMSWLYLTFAGPLFTLATFFVWFMNRVATSLRFGIAVDLHTALVAAPQDVALYTGDNVLHVHRERISDTWYITRVTGDAVREAASDLNIGQPVSIIPVQLYELGFSRWLSAHARHQKITSLPEDGVVHFNFPYGTTLPSLMLSVRTGATKADPRDAVRLAEELRQAKPDTN